MGLQNWLRQRYRQQLARRARLWDTQMLVEPAIVFAPHQDDETLGCGGTITMKRASGSRVQVVFLTDGSGSHCQFVSAEELRRVRQSEAVAACAQLGVREADIVFLAFSDGSLTLHREAAVDRVASILCKTPVQQVFVPSAEEPLADHAMTNRVVRDALASCQLAVEVFEYPVWYWFHWPWVGVRQNTRWMTRQVMMNTWSTWGGLRLIDTFPNVLAINDVLLSKRRALEAHRSQMRKPDSESAWPTLPEVASGEFLNCFFQGIELFSNYRSNGRPGNGLR